MLLYEVTKPVDLDCLEDALAAAFKSICTALEEGEPVVIMLDDVDVQALGELAEAALAHGLVGMCRALAIEGRKAGWSIAAISATPDVAAEERARWIAELGRPGAASGVVIRLGGAHLGRVPA